MQLQLLFNKRTHILRSAWVTKVKIARVLEKSQILGMYENLEIFLTLLDYMLNGFALLQYSFEDLSSK